MDKRLALQLIHDFYLFVYAQDGYSEFNDENGHFDFGKLMSNFKEIIVTKIGKKNFINMLKQILIVEEKYKNNDKNILKENVNKDNMKTIEDLYFLLKKIAFEVI